MECVYIHCYLILKDVLTGKSSLGKRENTYIYAGSDSGDRDFRLGPY